MLQGGVAVGCCSTGVLMQGSAVQDHALGEALDASLIRYAAPALPDNKGQAPCPVIVESEVRNIHRAVGTQLSHQVAPGPCAAL